VTTIREIEGVKVAEEYRRISEIAAEVAPQLLPKPVLDAFKQGEEALVACWFHLHAMMETMEWGRCALCAAFVRHVVDTADKYATPPRQRLEDFLEVTGMSGNMFWSRVRTWRIFQNPELRDPELGWSHHRAAARCVNPTLALQVAKENQFNSRVLELWVTRFNEDYRRRAESQDVEVYVPAPQEEQKMKDDATDKTLARVTEAPDERVVLPASELKYDARERKITGTLEDASRHYLIKWFHRWLPRFGKQGLIDIIRGVVSAIIAFGMGDELKRIIKEVEATDV